MIVHRTASRQVDPSLELSRCLTMSANDTETLTSRLLGLGSLESALTDVWAPHRDGRDPRALALSAPVRWAARALVDARDAPAPSAEPPAERHLRRAITAALRLPLPRTLDLQVPEGFAYDAIHPLAYDDATRTCLARCRPSRVVVVGLRTIGATLAAVVAARCEREGLPTLLTTLRPRGDPYARQCDVDEAWMGDVAAQHGALCLVVDDGPGLSGSSLTAAAEVLEACGHTADNVSFLCSRDPDPASFRSPRARARWGRHRRVVAPVRAPAFAEDWSEGRWREHTGLPAHCWPPVHPRHERHKGVPVDHPDRLEKFVGLGPYGAAVCRRAMRAAEAGFAVPVFDLRDGYLSMERLRPASPLGRRGTPALAATLARYLPWRATAMQTGNRAEPDALVELLRANTREHWGPSLDAGIARVERLAVSSPAQPAVIVDGRLLPCEWLQTPYGVIKVDGAEHGDDHFQPGPQDIAWDVSAALVEFAWTDAERASLIDRLAAAIRDPSLAERLRWAVPCYLAARLGYTSMAADTLSGTTDGTRFGRQARRYARQLRRALTSGT